MIYNWFERMINHIGTEKGPSFFRGQQWRIFDNERKFDRVMLCELRRFKYCKILLLMNIMYFIIINE